MTTIRKFMLARKIERHFWQKACEHDGISIKESFVIFSPQNPFLEAHDRAVKLRVKFHYQVIGGINAPN